MKGKGMVEGRVEGMINSRWEEGVQGRVEGMINSRWEEGG